MREALTGSAPVERRPRVDARRTTQGACRAGAPGCGDHAILAAVQRLCRDEQLAPEKIVFVSGIGCSSRFPHYMNTYGFHGLHGRALPVARASRCARPDLTCSWSSATATAARSAPAHWIHAIRYNMNMTVLMLDNGIYGLTKKQTSPTSPMGAQDQHQPNGAAPRPLNPLTTTLGVTNASFVAQTADWLPEPSLRDPEAGVPSPRVSRSSGSCSAARTTCRSSSRRGSRTPRGRRCSCTTAASGTGRDSRTWRRWWSTTLRTSTARGRSPRAPTRCRWGSFTATRTCPATRTCAGRRRSDTADDVRAALDAEFDKFTVKASI